MTRAYGKKTSLRPDDTAEHQLFATAANEQWQGKISICNTTSADQIYSLAHCDAGHGDSSALGNHWLAWEAEIQAGSAPYEYAVNMGPTESIRVKAGLADAVCFLPDGVSIIDE